MPRRRSPTPEPFPWSLSPEDPAAVANARILLGLIRVVRSCKGLLERRSADDVGSALAPVLVELPRELVAGMDAKRRELKVRTSDEPLDDEAFENPLRHHQGLRLLGEGLGHNQPAFRDLFDRAETLLERFIRKHPLAVDANVGILRDLLDLNEDEAAFTRFAACFPYGSIDRQVFDFVGGRPKVLRAIPGLIGQHVGSPQRLFDRDGALLASGLFENLRGGFGNCDLADALTLTPLGDHLLSVPFRSAEEMARAVLRPVPAPSRALHWPHLEVQRRLLEAALHSALVTKASGINILLHGAPGTGKTEFARHVIQGIGAKGFAVSDHDEKGAEAMRSERLAHLGLSQLFAGDDQPAVLVLDEAEDIFQNEYPHPHDRGRWDRTETKAWINRLLETNCHPVIWISNRVEHLDPAYLRRFAFCIEFPRTPRQIRRRIAAEYLAPLGCSEPVVESVASREHASPALVASAARFVGLSKGAGLPTDLAVVIALDQHLSAAGHSAPSAIPPRATRFDLRYLNLRGRSSAEAVIAALDSTKAGTALFAGPPGTGKTQLAAEIANRLGRELVYHTASDINTMWHGESERNVARMFRDCDAASEVLFLDEAEILLGSRINGSGRPDRAVTAEFLRWIEAFPGVFLCATNHADAFDGALSRRFVFRLEFLPLTVVQREAFFLETAGVGSMPVAERTRLAALDGLTPGDFANVVKRFRAMGVKASIPDWLAELETELRAKDGAPRARMGFV